MVHSQSFLANSDFGLPIVAYPFIPSQDMEDIQIVFQHMNLKNLREASRVSQDELTDWSTFNYEVTNKTTGEPVMYTYFVLIELLSLICLFFHPHPCRAWQILQTSCWRTCNFCPRSALSALIACELHTCPVFSFSFLTPLFSTIYRTIFPSADHDGCGQVVPVAYGHVFYSSGRRYVFL